MEAFIKVFLLMVKNRVKENIFGQMETDMQENGIIMYFQDMDSLTGTIKKFMQVNGKIIK